MSETRMSDEAYEEECYGCGQSIENCLCDEDDEEEPEEDEEPA